MDEAYVMRASGQHNMYPINMLLPEMFPNLNIGIICNSEISEHLHDRFDMKWVISYSGQGYHICKSQIRLSCNGKT